MKVFVSLFLGLSIQLFFLHVSVSKQLLFFVLSVLFLVTVISFPPCFFMDSSGRCIDPSTLSSMLTSLLHTSFLNTYSLSISSLWCKALCIIMGFLVLWSICWSSSLSILRIVLSILRVGQPRCLSLWWDLCSVVWFRVVFSFSWDSLF